MYMIYQQLCDINQSLTWSCVLVYSWYGIYQRIYVIYANFPFPFFAHPNIHSALGWVAAERVVHVFFTQFKMAWLQSRSWTNRLQRIAQDKPVFIPDNLGKTSILLKNYLSEKFWINIVIKVRVWSLYGVNISKSMILILLSLTAT